MQDTDFNHIYKIRCKVQDSIIFIGINRRKVQINHILHGWIYIYIYVFTGSVGIGRVRCSVPRSVSLQGSKPGVGLVPRLVDVDGSF